MNYHHFPQHPSDRISSVRDTLVTINVHAALQSCVRLTVNIIDYRYIGVDHFS